MLQSGKVEYYKIRDISRKVNSYIFYFYSRRLWDNFQKLSDGPGYFLPSNLTSLFSCWWILACTQMLCTTLCVQGLPCTVSHTHFHGRHVFINMWYWQKNLRWRHSLTSKTLASHITNKNTTYPDSFRVNTIQDNNQIKFIEQYKLRSPSKHCWVSRLLTTGTSTSWFLFIFP